MPCRAKENLRSQMPCYAKENLRSQMPCYAKENLRSQMPCFAKENLCKRKPPVPTGPKCHATQKKTSKTSAPPHCSAV
ncbi:hypothetical protein AMTR_s00040p00170990 [Amborella trichopoda]|uniref:Uncharacterized protein n=1 Tax=Amborella trichopoda TaxID=13333 RepID=W1PSV5_AMBTC|nr:hypothetical protein AMTR_s00040p00170990 [Amborella trichopoda]